MIYLITGGQRSGKSSHAQQLALSLTNKPIYIATARIWDEDFAERVERHKADRGPEWTSLEVEKKLGDVELKNKVAVIDCITLWITNFFTDSNGDTEQSLEAVKEELDQLFTKDATTIIVSNEIGMGTHATTEKGRKFADLQGWVNQYIAAKAHRVDLMVAGIPTTIKDTLND